MVGEIIATDRSNLFKKSIHLIAHIKHLSAFTQKKTKISLAYFEYWGNKQNELNKLLLIW